MTELVFGGGGILICVSIWFCIKAIVWLLSVYPKRGAADVEWQDQDVKDGTDWNHDDVEAVATLVREVVDEERTEADEDGEAAHFRLWHAELAGEKQIARGLRRMDRWSR